ncbi:MAG: PAS domain S-box protein [Planctomycetes bacterium]|nr:PAS domain S-box protein [Planctomycetota bacterium]
MYLLRNLKIRGKLILITMVTCVMVLLLSGGTLIVWQWSNLRQTMVRNLSIQAAMIADNCKAALAFEDVEDAETILKAFKVESSVVFGCIYNNEGELFATYYRGDSDSMTNLSKFQEKGYGFEEGFLTVFEPIELDGETIGIVCIRSDLEPMRVILRRNTQIIIAVLLFASVVAYFVSSRLQKIISRPILGLAKVAKAVSEKKDYSTRAIKQSNDEVGLLIDSFNSMLEQIQHRDLELVEINEKLEMRVSERTAELTVANEQLSRDVAERKRAAEALRQSEVKFKTIFENASGAIFIFEKDTGKIIDCNSQAEDILGCVRSEIIGVNKSEIFHGDILGGDKSASIQENSEGFEGRLIHKDSHEIPAWILFRKIELSGKDLMVGLFIDITERKKSEEELAETHRKLVEASHKAGMAEVATDVLHNVGNVLNSINVSATLITEKVTGSKLSNLKKVADMIKEHSDDLGEFLTSNEQGKHIPAYLTKVTKLLTDEQEDILEKLQSLAGNVGHIKEIVKMQQSYSKVSGVEMAASLAEVVENAIQINSSGLERHKISLVRDFEELAVVNIDKQRVLQILVNLIGNAKYALTNSEKDEKIMTIRLCKSHDDTFRFEVEDNGVGIAQENLTKIFRHGFTTKKHGHGFGLHSGALAAKEMGGSLAAESNGIGLGAKFVLELPFKEAGVDICQT